MENKNIGEIDYLDNHGQVADTQIFTNIEDFSKEIEKCFNNGVPVTVKDFTEEKVFDKAINNFYGIDPEQEAKEAAWQQEQQSKAMNIENNDIRRQFYEGNIGKAQDLINNLEDEENHTLFTDEEGDLIVNYAFHTEDFSKVEKLVDDIALEGYLKPDLRQTIENEIFISDLTPRQQQHYEEFTQALDAVENANWLDDKYDTVDKSEFKENLLKGKYNHLVTNKDILDSKNDMIEFLNQHKSMHKHFAEPDIMNIDNNDTRRQIEDRITSEESIQTLFSPEERNMLVTFALQTGDIDKANQVYDEVAFAGYGLKYGGIDYEYDTNLQFENPDYQGMWLPQQTTELEPDQKEMQRVDLIISDISAFTGISSKQLQALPDDVREDLINTYSNGIGVIGNENLRTHITAIVEMKPTQEEKYSSLAKTEELIEANCNQIDGIINNLPNDSTERPSVLEKLSSFFKAEKGKESNDIKPHHSHKKDMEIKM